MAQSDTVVYLALSHFLSWVIWGDGNGFLQREPSQGEEDAHYVG